MMNRVTQKRLYAAKGELEPSQAQLPLPLPNDDEAGLRSLLGMPALDAHAALADLDWDFADAQTDEFTHGVHSYPAKFIPQLPARFIASLSQPGELVIDPFSGGGTTGVEALRLGRRFLGVDANPVGVLLGEVKTTSLTARDWRSLDALDSALRSASTADHRDAQPTIPPIPNIEKWYAPAIAEALARIKTAVDERTTGPSRALALTAFVNTAARVSFQESETRYVSKPRAVDPQEPLRRFVSELARMSVHVRTLGPINSIAEVQFRLGDARERSDFPIEDGSAALIVTSPPYPNAYDYHLYHRFRLFWLGLDPAGLRRVEIGSHLKHQGEADPAASYEADMRSVLHNAQALLAPGRYCVLIVGDGIYRGTPYPTARRLADLAVRDGWIALPPISRSLPEFRRSVTSAGRRLRTEDVVLLKKPAATVRLRLLRPTYERYPYEVDLGRREVASLTGHQLDGSETLEVPHGSTCSVIEEVSRAAFWHGVEVEETGIVTSTRQRLLENPPPGHRKQSNYITHGLHRYKGKFYPQLAKALLNLSCVRDRSSLALDPFGGSGTVLLEAVLNGRDAVSIDCSPLATSVARTKVEVLGVDAREIERVADALVEALTAETPPETPEWDQFEPSTHEELESWFAPRVLAKLGQLLRVGRSVEDPRLVGLCEVLVSDLVREISHQEPRDLRIRRRAEPLRDAPVIELFEARLSAVVPKLLAFQATADPQTTLGTGRAVLANSAEAAAYIELDQDQRLVDAVVSSPPYATALPYLDTDRLSLAAVFGYDKQARRVLERGLIGSRETSKTEQRATESLIASGLAGVLPDSTASFLQALLEVTRSDNTAGFRRQQLPTVLAKYFVGVAAVLSELRTRLLPGSHLWFVLGDSRTQVGGRRWIIPTVDEFASIAKHAGYDYVERVPITVTREDVVHAKHAITENAIVHLRAAR